MAKTIKFALALGLFFGGFALPMFASADAEEKEAGMQLVLSCDSKGDCEYVWSN